ncbi:M23 family metallopeptidase [Acinetobacter apis]|uniref:Peptidase family M23 n=1 Tax=Acinetobacter apis TaxID=1229165 RepID=A0A217EHA3_9GAMM|nr:M23 family metallopeptidase [Acinetobacter apis]SNQ29560.1 Peptidase family M23 [Acinetobacter apis]
MQRILFAALSLFVSTASFADLIETTNSQPREISVDRLTKTLSAGSYDEQENGRVSTERTTNITLRNTKSNTTEQTLTATKKYTTSSNGIMSWLTKNPLPDAVRVSSHFGERIMFGKKEGHTGIDLAAPTGTSIYASGSGIVVRSGWVTGYGQLVEINHGNGYLTRYGHASRILVKVGDRIQAGTEIAKVGCTGRCTGAHLHYEIVADGKRKNPSTYLAMLP